jgi:Protein of unknown function (DUF1203)
MFIVRGLEPQSFSPLFALSDEALSERGARRMAADSDDAYPCRIALRRVEKGAELILLNYAHLPAPHSPYRASGPIFVSRSARGVYENELPPMLQDRLLALKAYDADAFILDADVAEGEEVRERVERFLDDPAVTHVDVHFARRGCFAARIERL